MKRVLKGGENGDDVRDANSHRLLRSLQRGGRFVTERLTAISGSIPHLGTLWLNAFGWVPIPLIFLGLCALQADETWTDLDIGTTGAAGGSSYDQNLGQFLVRGSGADIWGQSDAFHFVMIPVVGSCEITARVLSVENIDPWSKAGVMIREDLSPESRHAMVVLTPARGASFQRRTTKAGSSVSSTQAGPAAPHWVRLVRNGDLFLGFSSPDGITWTPLSSERIPMSANALVGLAVTSHKKGKVCAAAIDNVRVVSTPPPGSGTGLLGTYYNNSDFTAPQLSRIDPGVAFKWAAGGPDSLVGNETFSARWTGQIQARFSETYRIFTISDDGIRLWLDGELMIDNWSNHSATQNSFEVPLFAGDRHEITIEYFENTGSATAQLLWESPSEAKQPVAASELFPASAPLALQPPGNLRTIGATPTTLSLAWDHPPGATGAVVFDILRAGLTLASTSSSKFVLGGLTGGSTQNLVVRARDASGQISSDTAILNASTLPAPSLPQPWASLDIGSVQKTGNAGYQDGDWTVAGSGNDIWGTADRFHFAHLPLRGDGLMIARVTSQVPTDTWAKAGLMLRESLATGSRNAFIAWTPANGISFQWRQLAGKTSTNVRKAVSLDRGADGMTEPSIWLKLQREGDDIHGFFSKDGLEWELLGSTSIQLPSDLMAGFAVTSHNPQALSSARFDQFVLDYPPTVEMTEPANGLTLPASTPVTLTADAQSSTSAISKVDFFAGEDWLGESTEFPFTIVWQDAPNGQHEIQAIATDTYGLTAESQKIRFTIAEADSDADGLPDDWEIRFFGDLAQTASSDPDGDGSANRQELRFGSDPTDYLSQLGVRVSPKLSFIEGGNQTGAAGGWLPENLVVLVADALTGLPLRNARVEFSGSGGEVSPAAVVMSDNLGRASFRFRLPEQAGKGTLTASYGNASTSCRFTALSRDDDGDGIEDVWEISYFGDLESDNSADADGDGLSNKEEFLSGSDPHDPKDATYDPDGDGIPTLWEIRLVTDPVDAASKPPYDIIVDQSQPKDTARVKKTIQAALDAVGNLDPSKEFLTVYVREGRYVGKAWIPSSPTPRKVALIAEKSGFGVELTSIAPHWDAIVGLEGDCVVDGFHFRKQQGSRIGYVTAPFGKRIRAHFSNCIFSGGIDYYASCLFISNSDVLFTHCTIQNSGAPPAENTIYRFQESVSLRFLNSILWNPANPNEVSNPAAGAPDSVGSLIRGLEGASDPLLTLQGSLSQDSPARDAGSATLVSPVDIRGNPRDPVAPDIGAVEYSPDSDSDSDGLPDWLEALGIFDPVGDADRDGLTNLAEYTAGSNPRQPDSDGDGLWDGLEVTNNLNPLDGTDARDADKDGVADLQEVARGTNPQNSDTDGDGIPDGWEFFLNLNPSDVADASLDEDGDGLSAIQEFLLGTNLRLSDTDGDGLTDGYEAEIGYDPQVNDVARDTDQDGLSDLLEMRLGTNIFSSDSDDDGFDDLFETLSNTLDPMTTIDATLDSDGDGMNDLYELRYGLNLEVNDTGADPDQDGLSIGEEFALGSSPFDADIDNDGLNDFQERYYGTNPWHRDSEGEIIPDQDLTPGDGLPDGWEIKYGFNPLQRDDPESDTDGDGLGLFLEYRNGTNPLVPDTDGDGTNDGTEVANNTSPNNPNWGGPVPKAPTKVKVVTNSEGQRVVSWQDNSNNEDGFKIREKQTDGTWKIVAELPADTTSVVLP